MSDIEKLLISQYAGVKDILELLEGKAIPFLAMSINKVMQSIIKILDIEPDER